jgi:hypothetical protein
LVGVRPVNADHNAGAADAGEASARRWLVLIYRIPAEPTRLRAAVWRRIKGVGAIYLQNSVAAFPHSAAVERAFRTLRKEIADMGGTAHLMITEMLAGGADVEQAFNVARNDEYEEIIDKCNDFLEQIAKEYRAKHFTYAELEENDEDLVKLRNWFEKVKTRDVLGASGRDEVVEALSKCEAALEEYASRVYAEAGEGR